MTDYPHNLQRFVTAQASVYDAVVAELRAGRKQSHWMWFVFPQIAGLGHSAMAQRYAIADRAEAEAYLTHPLLGQRLRDCINLVLAVQGRSATQIFGQPDDVKFRSSMTLFAHVDPDGPFLTALQTFFDGDPDSGTLELL